MPARLSAPPARTRPRPAPDPGYDALPRLARLAADLASARRPPRTRWKEPPLFFFDRRRQAELGAARRAPAAEPHAELAARVAAELPGLCASVDVRHVARAVPGLAAGAAALAPACPAAADLAALLAVPDDEVFTVLHPGARAGFRLVARGVADVGQFHVLLAAAVTGDPGAGFLPGPPVSGRLTAACRDADPPAGEGPVIAEARYQMYTPAALGPDGDLPVGFGGSDHWLWPGHPLAAMPRVGGERVVLLGPPAYRATWEVTRRFPGLAAEVESLEVLNPFRVADRLAALTGGPVAVAPRDEPGAARAKAA